MNIYLISNNSSIDIERKVVIETIVEVITIKQVVSQKKIKNRFKTIITSEVAGEFLIKEIGSEAREVLMLLSLNSTNDIIAIHRVFLGTLNASICNPREIYQSALLNNASKIIIAHNHPSGNLIPSVEDLKMTEKIKSAGQMIGIQLMDHFIVNHDDYLSMEEFLSIL